jgi:hypothetical protein
MVVMSKAVRKSVRSKREAIPQPEVPTPPYSGRLSETPEEERDFELLAEWFNNPDSAGTDGLILGGVALKRDKKGVFVGGRRDKVRKKASPKIEEQRSADEAVPPRAVDVGLQNLDNEFLGWLEHHCALGKQVFISRWGDRVEIFAGRVSRGGFQGESFTVPVNAWPLFHKTRSFLENLAPIIEVGSSISPGYTKESPSSSPADTSTEGMGETETVEHFARRKGLTVAELEAAADHWKATNSEITARETTDRGTAQSCPDWIEARKSADGRRRDSKPIADVLAEFIRDKFAAEFADGTMSTQKLYRYEKLHSAFYNHRAELPPDLRDMQTRSELHDRMVAEGKVKPTEPPGMKAYDRGRMQVRRARRRGVVPII